MEHRSGNGEACQEGERLLECCLSLLPPRVDVAID